MLVLTRSRNQSIRVGHHVSIRILAVEGTQVRIGVEAPREVTIDREEIYNLKQRKDLTAKKAPVR